MLGPGVLFASAATALALNASLWPQPRAAAFGAASSPIDASRFAFALAAAPPPNASSEALDILAAAFERYGAIVFGGAGSVGAGGETLTRPSPHSAADAAPSGAHVGPAAGPGALVGLAVSLSSADDTLQLNCDESYSLFVPAPDSGGAPANATLACATVYGCLRGLETFSQSVVATASGLLVVAQTPLLVEDAPRFAHRGVMLDTSRHFLPLATLRAVIDGLPFDKLNTLHWHISDAQSFPLASLAVPELARGAWAPAATYSLQDLHDIVRYAKYRGVRVVPEVDSPAHAASWAAGRPDIVLVCGTGYSSLLDPSLEATYDAIAALFGELATVFTDDAFHIGVDEVPVDASSCYNTSHVNAWMPSANISAGDYKGVVRYHMARLQAIVEALGKRPSAWQEALDHYGDTPTNPTMPPAGLSRDTALHVWFDPAWEWSNMSFVVEEGFRGVKCDSWYLSDTTLDIWSAYAADPLTDAVCTYAGEPPVQNCTCQEKPDPTDYGCFNIADPSLIERVIGGEASVWGEQVDATNLLQTLWPRASAVAERLWSPQSVNDAALALPRLTDHRCRLVARGVPASPVQPGFCDMSRR
jgi:hexosaminidase